MNNNKFKKMEEYWRNQSKDFLHSDSVGMGAVIYSGMPVWFNNFFDKYQKKAFTELIKGIEIKNKKVLDVGCGVGRWSEIFAEKGADVTGVDFEKYRLDKAAILVKNKNVRFQRMSATDLKYKNDSFDFCNSITVMQHIPYAEKEKAAAEMSRVVKKGGHFLLIELIDKSDKAKHVFPLTTEEWVQMFNKNGLIPVKVIGNEYSFPLRVLRKSRQVLTGKQTIERAEGKVKLNPFEWSLMRMIISVSYPVEEVSIRFVNYNLARHVGILFAKRN